MQKKYTSKAEAWVKIQRFCAYQDRCHSEVRSKLLDMGVYGDTLEELMADLITERFLDEERFARSFAGGKFRIKHWGASASGRNSSVAAYPTTASGWACPK